MIIQYVNNIALTIWLSTEETQPARLFFNILHANLYCGFQTLRLLATGMVKPRHHSVLPALEKFCEMLHGGFLVSQSMPVVSEGRRFRYIGIRDENSKYDSEYQRYGYRVIENDGLFETLREMYVFLLEDEEAVVPDNDVPPVAVQNHERARLPGNFIITEQHTIEERVERLEQIVSEFCIRK